MHLLKFEPKTIRLSTSNHLLLNPPELHNCLQLRGGTSQFGPLQYSPNARANKASAFYSPALCSKAQCCQGRCWHFADRFCLTAQRLRASPQRESLIKFPLYSRLPELLAQNHTALQHANICQHSSLPSLPSSAHFHAPSLAIPRSPSLIHQLCSPFILTTMQNWKKKQLCGRIPPAQASAVLLWWKDVATERPMNNEAHVALHRERKGRDMREEGWLAGRPAEQEVGGNVNFPKRPKMTEAGWEGKQQHLCSALNRYLLEPEGDPAIVPEREYKKGEEMRVYLCRCLKTRLFLIHLTQVAERSPQLLCKTRVTSPPLTC